LGDPRLVGGCGGVRSLLVTLRHLIFSVACVRARSGSIAPRSFDQSGHSCRNPTGFQGAFGTPTSQGRHPGQPFSKIGSLGWRVLVGVGRILCVVATFSVVSFPPTFGGRAIAWVVCWDRAIAWLVLATFSVVAFPLLSGVEPSWCRRSSIVRGICIRVWLVLASQLLHSRCR
jgi:hypothetical protein